MELKLEIKFASVEELATVAKALTGLKVEGVPSKVSPAVNPILAAATEQAVAQVEKVNPSNSANTIAAAEPKLTAAEKKAAEKAAKKEQEEAEKADRIARLKAQMEQPDNKAIADAALERSRTGNTPSVNQEVEESAQSIAEEIKALGDKLMAYTGIPLEAKQQLTGQVMTRVGVPQGVRPSQLEQPMLGQFRDEYRSAVESVMNPVMGGLV